MIPVDHWHENGDGTAWLVSEDGWIDNYAKMRSLTERGGDLLRLHHLDRPCDTCDGDMVVHGPNQSRHEAARHARCPACIDGRHTFWVEVAWQTEVDAYESERHRVSVVPGMVEEQEDGTWRVQLKIHQ
jgi:hypothetical protein